MPTNTRFLPLKEVAFTCGCDPSTLRRACRRGEVECRRFGRGHWRILVDEEGWPLEAQEEPEPARGTR